MNTCHSPIDALALQLKAERDQRELRCEHLQIKARAIEFPVYDNSDLHSLERWLVTGRNLQVLANYFHQIVEATGGEPLDSEEARVMTIIQYERQLQARDAQLALQPRDSKWDEEQQQVRRTWQALMADDVCVPEFGEL